MTPSNVIRPGKSGTINRFSAKAHNAEFMADILRGLHAKPKTISSRWLYDQRGSELFEAITTLEEYYPTRTETDILRDNSRDIAAFVGPNNAVIEYGAG